MNNVVTLGQKQEKASGISFDDLLKSTATDKPASKKKEVPTIQEVPPEVKQAVDDYLSAKEIKKSAEAQLDITGAMVSAFVKAHQDREGFKGHFRDSYRVQGVNKTITFVSTNRWTINAC